MERARSILSPIAPAAAILLIARVGWPVSGGTLISGLIVGVTGSLLALGMALIWRARRIVSFAQADLGLLPATVAIVLGDVWSLPWLVFLAVGLAAAIVIGLAVEVLLMRRFRDTSPAVGTVATIGVAQLMSFGAVFFPTIWGLVPAIRTFDPPFEIRITIGQVIFDANDVLAAAVSVVAIAALAWFLRSSATGLAVRAVAESPDRAALLGIHVGRIGALVWIIATVLAFVSVFFTAGITGLPPGLGFSFGLLLTSLAALVVGRMSNLVTIVTTSVALGILETSMSRSASGAALIGPMLLGVISVTLLLRSRSGERLRGRMGGWNTATEFRDIPASVASLVEVRAVRAAVAVVIAVTVMGLPAVLGTAGTLTAANMCAYAVVGLSVMVLSGWAGQVSLGQMAFVGTGAAITARTSSEWGLDPAVSMVLSGLVGAVVALVIGVPALRLRGLYLAVVTLALSAAASSAVFSNDLVEWIPVGSFDRPELLSRVPIDTPQRQFYLALAVLALAVVAVRGMRRSRWGRALVAQRDNEDAAAAFGVSAVYARLSAFAVSGFIAGVGGSLLVYQAAAFRPESYSVGESVSVFVAAVTGGIGTPLGAVVGALYLARLAVAAARSVAAPGLGGGGPGSPADHSRGAQCGVVPQPRRSGAAHRRAPRHRFTPPRPPDGGDDVSREDWRMATSGLLDVRRWGAGLAHPIETLRATAGDGPLFALMVLFGLNIVDELDRTAFGVLVPTIRDEFGLSDTGITTLIALSALAALVLQLPIAWWADRGSRVRLAAAGGLAWGVFSFLTGTASVVWVLVVYRMGAGVGRAVVDPTHSSLLADYFPVERRASVFGLHRSANAIGQFIGPLTAGLLAEAFGWRVPFFVFGIPTIILVLVALKLREPIRGAQERRAAGLTGDAVDTEEPPRRSGSPGDWSGRSSRSGASGTQFRSWRCRS